MISAKLRPLLTEMATTAPTSNPTKVIAISISRSVVARRALRWLVVVALYSTATNISVELPAARLAPAGPLQIDDHLPHVVGVGDGLRNFLEGDRALVGDT